MTMSKKYYIHATPTLFNAGMKKQQLSSCYLIAMKEDSMEGIFDALKACALIHKTGGGVNSTSATEAGLTSNTCYTSSKTRG